MVKQLDREDSFQRRLTLTLQSSQPNSIFLDKKERKSKVELWLKLNEVDEIVQ